MFQCTWLYTEEYVQRHQFNLSQESGFLVSLPPPNRRQNLLRKVQHISLTGSTWHEWMLIPGGQLLGTKQLLGEETLEEKEDWMRR